MIRTERTLDRSERDPAQVTSNELDIAAPVRMTSEPGRDVRSPQLNATKDIHLDRRQARYTPILRRHVERYRQGVNNVEFGTTATVWQRPLHVLISNIRIPLDAYIKNDSAKDRHFRLAY